MKFEATWFKILQACSDGVFVKIQLGNKSTFNSLVISQPKNIGKKSTFNLLVLYQPRYIEMKIQPLIH